MLILLAACDAHKPDGAEAPAVDTGLADSGEDTGAHTEDTCPPQPEGSLEAPTAVRTWHNDCEGTGRHLELMDLSGGPAIATSMATCGTDISSAGSVTLLTFEAEEVFSAWGEAEGTYLGTRLALGSAASGLPTDMLAAAWGPSELSHLGEGGVQVYDAWTGNVLFGLYEPGVWMAAGLAYSGDMLVTGAPMADDRGGVVYLWATTEAGELSAADALVAHHGRGVIDELGTQVYDLGDIDGDGVADVFIDGRSASVFVSGEDLVVDEGFLNGLFFPSLTNGDSVANVGDMDGDGLEDIAIGALSSAYSASGHVEIRGGDLAAPFAILGDDRGLALDIGEYVSDMGEVAEPGRGAFAVLAYPDEFYEDSAEIWIVEGPLCGVVPFSEAGYLYDELTDARYERQLAAAGSVVGVVGDHDGVAGTLQLLYW